LLKFEDVKNQLNSLLLDEEEFFRSYQENIISEAETDVKPQPQDSAKPFLESLLRYIREANNPLFLTGLQIFTVKTLNSLNAGDEQSAII